MRILMDADCLIKLTKAGLKEAVCQQYEITIPIVVKREVVDAGKDKGLPDADVVEKNIQKKTIRVSGKGSLLPTEGDRALIEMFRLGQYDSIATDDIKLIRHLRSTGIPFVLPGLFIYDLYHEKKIEKSAALNWLEKLSAFINEDEHSIVKLLLEENR